MSKLVFKQFLENYGSHYSKEAINYLNESFEFFLQPEHIVEAPDILMQIYTYLNLIDYSCYDIYCQMIQEYFNIDSNILEIGCGYIPVLSDKIANKQKNGSITVYDPLLCVTNFSKLKINKKTFTMLDSTSFYDLIIGTFPCEATEIIISKALHDHKEMFLAMCGCTHFSPIQLQNISYLTYDIWIDYILNLIDTHIDKEEFHLKIDFLNKKDTKSYPILSLIRK